MFRNALVLLLLLASVAFAQRGRRATIQQDPKTAQAPASKTAAPAKQTPAIEAPELTPELKAQRDSLERQAFIGEYKADVHVRYHITQTNIWWWCDIVAKAGLAIVSVGMFAAPLLFPKLKTGWPGVILKAAGLSLLLCALLASYLAFGDWQHEQSELANKWASLASEWKELNLRQPKLSQDEWRSEIARLVSAEAAIEKDAPKVHSPTMLARAQREQNRHLEAESSQ